MRHGGPIAKYREILQAVEQTPGVEAATPFIYAQIMLRSNSGASGAVLRGIDPKSAGRVMDTLRDLYLPSSTAANASTDGSPAIPGIVLGLELAKNLSVGKGDVIYLFTDGFIDQIGGTDNKKYLTSRLKKLLKEIHNLSMNEQKEIVEKTFFKWKMNEKQVDDVTVMGLKI